MASSAQAQASCQHLKGSNVAKWNLTESPGGTQDLIAAEPKQQRVGRGQLGWRYQADSDDLSISWTVVGADNSSMTALQIEQYVMQRPVSQWVLNASCEVQSERTIHYDQSNIARTLSTQLRDQAPVVEQLNPAVPEPESAASALSAVLVALVDSGVNYTLPQINSRLARNKAGELLSKDYWDNDSLPFDAHPTGSAFNITRHGTRTASILLREAPDAQLVAYRYPRPDMSRMQQLVADAASHNVSVIGLPLGGNRLDQWEAFAAAAKQHPGMLFIASAGNNGRNIDQQPVYPASLSLDNLLVVTSADDFVRPAERVNWGRSSVDYMLPAESVQAIDFDGSIISVSGSSYAVPRAVAIAARMKASNPSWQAQAIKAEFARRYATGANSRHVGGGYIADPLADSTTLAAIESQIETTIQPSTKNEGSFTLPLSLFALGDSWSTESITSAVREATTLLKQCEIAVPPIELQRVTAADYLMDLSVSSGHTLFSKLRPAGERHPVAVVFARDTTMLDPYDGEAFGEGNTRSRAWMRDSVWLTHGIRDAGIALAHELFHVLANSGTHSRLENNLMRAQTQHGGTVLTSKQCELASTNALSQGLLSPNQ